MSPDDIKFMKRALRLARKGHTSPNPMVGAVIVNNGEIVGEGFHPKAGEPHAEVFALREAGEKAHGASLYVTLEPCCHYGRTPPCADAVIEAGVSRVYAAMTDPNPLVSGKGIERLRNAGIEVIIGLMEDDARELNRGFVKRIQTGMPFLLWKAAMSLDGKIAANSGDSKWITGERSRKEVQRLRNTHDAIITGVGTVLADDPLMTVHSISRPHNPIRIVVDSKASIPESARILNDDAPTYLAVTKNAPSSKLEVLKSKCHIMMLPSNSDGKVDLRKMMLKLGELGINTAMLECGGELAASMIKEYLVDRGIIFVAPRIIGGRQAKTIVDGSGINTMSEAVTTSALRIRRFGSDILLSFNIAK